MIIVSQSKNNIVNFENINLIGLAGEFKIKARLGINDEVLLGKYKTEERAKEVLQEIVKRINGKGEIIKNVNEIKIETEARSVYEMPED